MEIKERQKAIEKAIERIKDKGPDRVLIRADSDGQEGVSYKKALEMEIKVDVVFIRSDAWSLGAPADLRDEALKLWADTWLAFVNYPELVPREISELQVKKTIKQKTFSIECKDKRILDSIWFTNCLTPGTTGLVLIEDRITGDRKIYVGQSPGQEKAIDAKLISDFGSPVPIDETIEFLLQARKVVRLKRT